MFFNFEKFYKKKLPKKQIFIDVGANLGDWFTVAKRKYKNSKIYAFEPIKGITKKRKDVKIINQAVDIRNNQMKILNITRETVTSSLLNQERSIINKFVTFKDEKGKIHRKSDYDIIKKIKVRTIRLDNFIKKNNLREIHYLKIDAEGNDLNVLKSAGKYLKIVWGFEIETWNEKKTLWKNQSWINSCEKFIKKNGFVVAKKFIHGKGRSTDLLCVKKELFNKL